MNWKKIIRKCYDSILAKFPKNAIRFPYLVNLNDSKVTQETELEIRHVRTRFSLEDLYIVHGSAFSIEGRNYLISWPPGCGKSTFLAEQKKEGLVTPLEDSLVLVGRNKEGKFVIVHTGAYPTEARKAKIDQWLRRVAGFKSAYLGSKSEKELERLKARERQLVRMGLLPSTLLPRDRTSFEPKASTLEKWIFLHHPEDRMWTRHIQKDNQVKRISGKDEVAAEFGHHVKIIDSTNFEHPRQWQRAVRDLLQRS